MWWSLWWVWLSAALALAILEMLAPVFVFLGFAIGAGVIGLLLALGLNVPLFWLLVIFALVSLLSWVALRQMLGVRHGQRKVWKRDINED